MHKAYAASMTESAQAVFDRTASAYDRQRALLIPGYADFYRWAVDLIPAGARTIVDLGAGTGLLAMHVLERLPGALLHLIDVSEAMLAQARQRFAANANVTFETGDYSVVALPAPTDAVISALSIHHLVDGQKRALFAGVARSLRPGGVFINADQVLGPTPHLERHYRTAWLDQVRALGASETQIEESLFRQQADRCASVEDQLGWMREHFIDVDCAYKNGCFAVMRGTRP